MRHNDGIDWTGKRREGTGETEVWKTKKGKRKKKQESSDDGRTEKNRNHFARRRHWHSADAHEPVGRRDSGAGRTVRDGKAAALRGGHFEGNRDEVTVNAEHVYQGAGAWSSSPRRLYQINEELEPDKKLFVREDGTKADLATFVQRWVEYQGKPSEEAPK